MKCRIASITKSLYSGKFKHYDVYINILDWIINSFSLKKEKGINILYFNVKLNLMRDISELYYFVHLY